MPFPFVISLKTLGWLSEFARSNVTDAIHTHTHAHTLTQYATTSHPALAQVGQMARLQSIKCVPHIMMCVLYPRLSLRALHRIDSNCFDRFVWVLSMPQIVQCAQHGNATTAVYIYFTQNFKAPHRMSAY